MKLLLAMIASVAFLLPQGCSASAKAPYVWRDLGGGIQYATYSFEPFENERTSIHAFRIDPALHSLDVAVAADEKQGTTAEEMARKRGALLAINGGFFTPEHASIGLIIRNGKRLSPLHNTSWWSVFSVANDRPSISSPSEFRPSDDISMALQVGPRLTVGGKTPKLKEGISTRTAIGIDRQGKVVIAITSGHGISLKEMAKRMGGAMLHGGFDCPDSMALDGGGSSQLYARHGDFSLSLEGIARVTNGIVVIPRKK